jgi:DegV family protein with EDD domain
MGVKIITDSGYDLSPQLEKELGIGMVPLMFRFGLQEFMDKSMPMRVFLEKIAQIFPTTSAPSPGDYIRVFKESLQDHDQVVCITISSKHSTSYASAVLASQQFEAGRVTVVDSETLSIAQGLLAMMAARAAQLGENAEKISAMLHDLQRRLHLFITLDTVQYLVKGGRADQITGFLAGLLKIRPILTLVNGQLTLLSKQVGRKASIQKLMDLAVSYLPAEVIMVGHVGCVDEALHLVSSLSLIAGVKLETIPVIETGMALAAHAGPGTLGVLVLTQK